MLVNLKFSVLGLSLCLLVGVGWAQEVDPVEALSEVIPGEPGWVLRNLPQQ